MITLPQETKDQLRTLGVLALYLFGSRAQGVAGPGSDYDFGVLMQHGGSRRGDALYDALYDLLGPLCPRTLENDVIDIVFLNDAPLELRMHVVRYGIILCESDSLQRGRFEQETMLAYADFKPILDMMDSAILAKL